MFRPDEERTTTEFTSRRHVVAEIMNFAEDVKDSKADEIYLFACGCTQGSNNGHNQNTDSTASGVHIRNPLKHSTRRSSNPISTLVCDLTLSNLASHLERVSTARVFDRPGGYALVYCRSIAQQEKVYMPISILLVAFNYSRKMPFHNLIEPLYHAVKLWVRCQYPYLMDTKNAVNFLKKLGFEVPPLL
ncbi:hypothetical protein EVAR_38341_1 [Eumeta japonica]|uniref:Uncharacterized protein n=1 Tax=Eumeta variegata TaxID=151549 RepID=A0A4C1X3F9_EUMVA|nr:hypothetical protein EVAR_38341_1 [Eumeta japonica]